MFRGCKIFLHPVLVKLVMCPQVSRYVCRQLLRNDKGILRYTCLIVPSCTCIFIILVVTIYLLQILYDFDIRMETISSLDDFSLCSIYRVYCNYYKDGADIIKYYIAYQWADGTFVC